MSLQTTILKIAASRPRKGITVGETFERFCELYDAGKHTADTRYSTIRARVYELELKGQLVVVGTRKDPISGEYQRVFKVPAFSPSDY